MTTAELILLLSRGVTRVRPGTTRRRLGTALVVGVALSCVLGAALAELVPALRTDTAQLAREPSFWLKAGLCGAVAFFCTVALDRLARPGADLDGSLGYLTYLPLVISGMPVFLAVSEAEWSAVPRLFLGRTWWLALPSILLLALPVFACLRAALRRLAPVFPGHAGGVAGMLAAALGGAVYGLHCPEQSVAFIIFWHDSAIGIGWLAGQAYGERRLRW